MPRIRLMKRSDFRSIIRLTNEERWGFGIRDLKRMMALQPRGCLVAVVDKHTVGFTTAISYGRELGWIGNVVVHREHRRAGIGSNLVRTAVRYLLRSHVKRIGLFSFLENRSMYERLDFGTTGGFVRLSTPRRAGGKATQNGGVPFRQILRLDKRAFGADRARLLKRLLREFPKNWTWTRRGAKLSGYSVVKQYQDSSEIGPSVSKEMDYDATTTLLQYSTGLARKWPLELSVPESNRTVLETAGELGFRVVRKGLVMSHAGSDPVTVSPAIIAFGFLDKG